MKNKKLSVHPEPTFKRQMLLCEPALDRLRIDASGVKAISHGDAFENLPLQKIVVISPGMIKQFGRHDSNFDSNFSSDSSTKSMCSGQHYISVFVSQLAHITSKYSAISPTRLTLTHDCHAAPRSIGIVI
jgi:hypothetical protein